MSEQARPRGSGAQNAVPESPETEVQRKERELAEAKARAPVTRAELEMELNRLREEYRPLLAISWTSLERGQRRTAFILKAVCESDTKVLAAAKEAGDKFDEREREREAKK